jgi:integrase
MKDECLICGAPLKYLETEQQIECAVCHKKENSNTVCQSGHYVCNECHTVHSTEEGIVPKDRLKTKSSYRTLTLEPFVRGELLKHREKQEQMKKVMRSAYSKEYTDYVCVDALGKLYDPDFITEHFRQLLKKHNLKKIRFHDLRHSCASVLLAQGVPMKQIQEWLGHSDMSTTANIYSHLDAVTKADTGAAMSKALG